MEAGDYSECFINIDDRHERIRKTAKQSATHVLVDFWELAGCGADALNRGINRNAEMTA
jgi:hypothetical protein